MIRRCVECADPVDHAGRGLHCLRCQRIRDRNHGDALADLAACRHCGDCWGPLVRWAPPDSALIRALEEAGLVRVDLYCDACLTCIACSQIVMPFEGMPTSVHRPALHRRCIATPAGQAVIDELRRMLTGGISD